MVQSQKALNSKGIDKVDTSRWNRRLKSKIPDGYVESIEFVMKNRNQKFFNYVVADCQDKNLALAWPLENVNVSRNMISYVFESVDIVICVSFVLFIWYCEQKIEISATK